MARYRQLFNVAVEHAYFASGRCPVLSFQPTPATAASLASAGCLFLRHDVGFEVCHDETATAAMRLCLAEPPWRLTWLGHCGDARFVNYTEGLGGHGGLLTFENTDASVLLRASVPHVGPPFAACAVTLSFGPPLLHDAPRNYRVGFAARGTHWKYHFTGGWLAQTLRIVDPAGQVQFDAPQLEPLADGQAAQVISSSTAIALQERPRQSFALRARHGSGERVLIKRLPAAGAAQLNRGTVQGAMAWISEIHVPD
jgi:hypothetical protein